MKSEIVVFAKPAKPWFC